MRPGHSCPWPRCSHKWVITGHSNPLLRSERQQTAPTPPHFCLRVGGRKRAQGSEGVGHWAHGKGCDSGRAVRGRAEVRRPGSHGGTISPSATRTSGGRRGAVGMGLAVAERKGWPCRWLHASGCRRPRAGTGARPQPHLSLSSEWDPGRRSAWDGGRPRSSCSRGLEPTLWPGTQCSRPAPPCTSSPWRRGCG